MPKLFYKSRVKMFLSRWKVAYVWILMWLTITESAFSALRKTMNPSNFQSAANLTKNQTKFGRKLSSTLPLAVSVITSTSTFIEPTTFRPIFSEKNLETEKIVDQTLENKNQKNESGIAVKISENIKNDGLLWRSMTDGKSLTGYLVPETNVNISLRQPELLPNNVEQTKNAYLPGSHTYIYATSTSLPSLPYAPTQNQQNGQNKYTPFPNGDPRNMPANTRYNAYDSRTRSPRYGTPAAPMTMMMNKPGNQYHDQQAYPPQQQYHQQPYSHSPPTPPQPQYQHQQYSHSPPTPPQPPHYGGSPMPSGSPSPAYPSYGATPSYNYNNPMPMPMTPGYGMPMMAAKEDTGLKGMLSKLLALLPVGLLLAVALPSLITFPARRSLEGNIYAGVDSEPFKNKLTHSYPVLDMIKYYGSQTFQNESCFRYIVCETVKMGSEDGANVIQKQLWTIANRFDATLARSMGLNDLWEGITKHSCQKFNCDWKTNTDTTNKPDKLEKVS